MTTAYDRGHAAGYRAALDREHAGDVTTEDADQGAVWFAMPRMNSSTTTRPPSTSAAGFSAGPNTSATADSHCRTAPPTCRPLRSPQPKISVMRWMKPASVASTPAIAVGGRPATAASRTASDRSRNYARLLT